MKYNYYSSLQKIIALLLVCLFPLVLSACNGEDTDENETSSAESLEDSLLSTEDAVALIELDKTITDIFINNSLCDNKSSVAKAVAVTSGDYVSFSAIEALLDSAYTASGGNKDMFLSYPEGYSHTPSVSDVDGTTYVFNHIGSSYKDFIVTSTVSVSNTDNENEQIITAQTESGKSVELKAVFENDKWRLESGIFAVSQDDVTECESRFPLSHYGSFMDLSGNILVIELYVSDLESGFTSIEESGFHRRIKNAFDYMTEQAKGYGREVTVTYESAYFDHYGTLGVRALDFDIVFAETGFGTLQNFADVNFDLAAYDNYVFVVCLDKNVDVSYACYNGTDETQLYFAERVIMGKNTTDAEVCVSALGLLGAYGFDEGKCDEYTESLYGFYFPYDIMVSKKLSSSTFSPVTAFACGITDKLDPFYRVFFYE